MAAIYPICIKLDNLPCLVVGGGKVAERKVKALLAAGGRVTVIGPDITPDLKNLALSDKLVHVARPYKKGDVDGFFLVISATNDRQVNREIAAECHQRRILLNTVDDPENCTFYVPATVRRGDLVIAVSTGGKSPLMARKIREELEHSYNDAFGAYLDLLGEIRHNIIRNVRDTGKKEALLEELLSEAIWAALKKGDYDKAKELVSRVYNGSGSESPDGSCSR
ncbi:MAG: bifunctional precorrin-2 dehydrogenase/sirohydrochlorin ferrochelatase [Peptococcaceae bacterium]|nr:bifunctional precorrin-2 dehydrogenase/sirohydrochlorin ferrochelatase [Peptococcaceae bacterium]